MGGGGGGGGGGWQAGETKGREAWPRGPRGPPESVLTTSEPSGRPPRYSCIRPPAQSTRHRLLRQSWPLPSCAERADGATTQSGLPQLVRRCRHVRALNNTERQAQVPLPTADRRAHTVSTPRDRFGALVYAPTRFNCNACSAVQFANHLAYPEWLHRPHIRRQCECGHLRQTRMVSASVALCGRAPFAIRPALPQLRKTA